jgi:hypothetical protein
MACGLFALSLIGVPYGTAAAEAHVITGELVVTNAAARQFRVVDHGGFFTAPAGTYLEELDGKPVEVELSGRRVLQITEKHIPINPMLRHYEIVTGQLVVGNAAAGTFTISGDGRTYIAPREVDVRLYANQMVDVFLDESGQVRSLEFSKRSVLPSGSSSRYSTACAYNGESFADGALACQSGMRYRCESGLWRSIGGPCVGLNDEPCDRDGATYSAGSTRCERNVQFLCEDGAWRNIGTACVSDVTLGSARLRSCVVGDATVSVGSTICRDGTTYRCSDGRWFDVGTACR